jgi:hypothetical protein
MVVGLKLLKTFQPQETSLITTPSLSEKLLFQFHWDMVRTLSILICRSQLSEVCDGLKNFLSLQQDNNPLKQALYTLKLTRPIQSFNWVEQTVRTALFRENLILPLVGLQQNLLQVQLAIAILHCSSHSSTTQLPQHLLNTINNVYQVTKKTHPTPNILSPFVSDLIGQKGHALLLESLTKQKEKWRRSSFSGIQQHKNARSSHVSKPVRWGTKTTQNIKKRPAKKQFKFAQ